MLQLVREWPPGYGGVERVAHELANAWAEQHDDVAVFSLLAQPAFARQSDPLPVHYKRITLPRWGLNELLIPLPSPQLIRMLWSTRALHAHLPCPAVLLLAALAKGIQPKRVVTVHWHAFLAESRSLKGRLMQLYQAVALALLPLFDRVVTTSPALQQALIESGLKPTSIAVLPCCLSSQQEQTALSQPIQASTDTSAVPALRLISISRLGSYKRIDWLLEAVGQANQTLIHRGENIRLQVDVIGDGPDRQHLETLSQQRLPGMVSFHGRVDEAQKMDLLKRADLLVLLASSCNEAFGIVQLEAMACAVPAVALALRRSGMHWVSETKTLQWEGTLTDLPALIVDLACDPLLQQRARQAARARYLEVFARQRWLRELQKAFKP